MTGESLVGLPERLRSALDELQSAAMGVHPADVPWLRARLAADPDAVSQFDRLMGVVDPAYVLRTIQAHRKIVEIHYSAWSAAGDICFACDDGSGVEATWPCATLRALASIYFPESDG